MFISNVLKPQDQTPFSVKNPSLPEFVEKALFQEHNLQDAQSLREKEFKAIAETSSLQKDLIKGVYVLSTECSSDMENKINDYVDNLDLTSNEKEDLKKALNCTFINPFLSLPEIFPKLIKLSIQFFDSLSDNLKELGIAQSVACTIKNNNPLLDALLPYIKISTILLFLSIRCNNVEIFNACIKAKVSAIIEWRNPNCNSGNQTSALALALSTHDAFVDPLFKNYDFNYGNPSHLFNLLLWNVHSREAVEKLKNAGISFKLDNTLFKKQILIEWSNFRFYNLEDRGFCLSLFVSDNEMDDVIMPSGYTWQEEFYQNGLNSVVTANLFKYTFEANLDKISARTKDWIENRFFEDDDNWWLQFLSIEREQELIQQAKASDSSLERLKKLDALLKLELKRNKQNPENINSQLLCEAFRLIEKCKKEEEDDHFKLALDSLLKTFYLAIFTHPILKYLYTENLDELTKRKILDLFTIHSFKEVNESYIAERATILHKMAEGHRGAMTMQRKNRLLKLLHGTNSAALPLFNALKQTLYPVGQLMAQGVAPLSGEGWGALAGHNLYTLSAITADYTFSQDPSEELNGTKKSTRIQIAAGYAERTEQSYLSRFNIHKTVYDLRFNPEKERQNIHTIYKDLFSKNLIKDALRKWFLLKRAVLRLKQTDNKGFMEFIDPYFESLKERVKQAHFPERIIINNLIEEFIKAGRKTDTPFMNIEKMLKELNEDVSDTDLLFLYSQLNSLENEATRPFFAYYEQRMINNLVELIQSEPKVTLNPEDPLILKSLPMLFASTVLGPMDDLDNIKPYMGKNLYDCLEISVFRPLTLGKDLDVVFTSNEAIAELRAHFEKCSVRVHTFATAYYMQMRQLVFVSTFDYSKLQGQDYITAIAEDFQRTLIPYYAEPFPEQPMFKKNGGKQFIENPYFGEGFQTHAMYLQAVKDGVALPRHWHGTMHATRATIWTAALIGIYKEHGIKIEVPFPIALFAAGLHDAAREDDGIDRWDDESGQVVRDYLYLVQQVHDVEMLDICTHAVAEKDPKPNEPFKSALQEIIQAADCLEIQREKAFDKKYLYFSTRKEFAHFPIDQLIKEIGDFIKLTENLKLRLLLEQESNNYLKDVLYILNQAQQKGKYPLLSKYLRTMIDTLGQQSYLDKQLMELIHFHNN